jgi:hypothetical protein
MSEDLKWDEDGLMRFASFAALAEADRDSREDDAAPTAETVLGLVVGGLEHKVAEECAWQLLVCGDLGLEPWQLLAARDVVLRVWADVCAARGVPVTNLDASTATHARLIVAHLRDVFERPPAATRDESGLALARDLDEARALADSLVMGTEFEPADQPARGRPRKAASDMLYVAIIMGATGMTTRRVAAVLTVDELETWPVSSKAIQRHLTTPGMLELLADAVYGSAETAASERCPERIEPAPELSPTALAESLLPRVQPLRARSTAGKHAEVLYRVAAHNMVIYGEAIDPPEPAVPAYQRLDELARARAKVDESRARLEAAQSELRVAEERERLSRRKPTLRLREPEKAIARSCATGSLSPSAPEPEPTEPWWHGVQDRVTRRALAAADGSIAEAADRLGVSLSVLRRQLGRRVDEVEPSKTPEPEAVDTITADEGSAYLLL